MRFPLGSDWPGVPFHPHVVFEALAFFAGTRAYFAQPGRAAAGVLSRAGQYWLLAGCIFGAWAGAKLLAWVESPEYYLALARVSLIDALGGTTIVGGLLGGWVGIEWAKSRLGILGSTGDAFVWPLTIGIAIGRIGCFLTGLEDRTHGLPTSLPWGVDFGDGLSRHPTQLYECVFVVALGAAVTGMARSCRLVSGARFRFFLAGYFLFRLLIEFIKPRETLLGVLSAIQVAGLAGFVLALVSLRRLSPSEP